VELILILIALYMIPSIVAGFRNKRNSGAIVALNILLGWTLVGWTVALVWALTTDASGPYPEYTMLRPCPSCLSQIPVNATACRFCQRAVAPPQPPQAQLRP
jgi:Superinfection immunity protein